MFTFTEYDAGILGTCDEVVAKHGFQRSHLEATAGWNGLLDCVSYTFRVADGFRRHVPLGGSTQVGAVQNFEVRKRSDGNGLFPTVACQKAVYEISYLDGRRKEFTIRQLENMKEYISYRWEGNLLHLENRNPQDSMLEFDFPAHSYGAKISVLTRPSVENVIAKL